MSTPIGLSHTDIVGPLLPVTGAFAIPFTAYFSLLSARVVFTRMRYHAPLGVEECRGAGASAGVEGEKHHRHDHDHDHDHNDKHRHDHDHDHEHSLNEDPLYIASRCHENFIENVPFALILAAVAELNGASKKVLTVSLGALLFARICHVEFGLRRAGAEGWGRVVGYSGTLGTMGFLAGYGGWLVRGYLGRS